MYCSQCGAENTDTSAFCRQCGVALRQPQAPTKLDNAPQPTPAPVTQTEPSDVIAISSPSRIAGVICYLFGWISGIIFLLVARKNEFIRFHAWQSTITFIILTVLIFIFHNIVIFLLSVLLWFLLIFMALQGKEFKLPGIGGLAQKLSQR